MVKTITPSERGMLDSTQAPPSEFSSLFKDDVTKYNQCHGPKGKFCSGGGGKSGGGGARSASNKPGEELKTHPPVQGARVKLAPLVGQKVTFSYWTELPGSGGKHRCLRDVKIEGKPIKYQHMWAQNAPQSVMSVPYGQQQRATGTVYRYKKKKGWDWAIGDLQSVTNKSAELEKYNHCHDNKGQFCSSGSGGSGGGGGGGANVGDTADTPAVIVGDVPITPKVELSPLQDKTFKKPDNLTQDEYSALRQYGGTEYAVLNSRLRNQDPAEWPDKAKWMTQNIDSAIAKQEPLKGPMKVYRGTDYGKLFGKKKPEEIVGAKILDKGFMSTSASSEVAERFGGARFTISLPAGMKALDMAKNTGTVAARSEREWLLPRGTQIEITHVTQTKGGFLGIGKKTYIEARVVPVEKALLEKFNHCHDAHGKFCSSGGGSAGGGSFKRDDVKEKHINAAYREEIGSTMQSLAKDYPKTAKYIEIESKDFSWSFDPQMRQQTDSYAVFQKNKISLNANQMNKPDLKQRLQHELEVGWSSTGTIAGIVDHEFGHAVMDRLVEKAYKNPKIDNSLNKAMNFIIQNPISTYAKTSHDEAFAEAFAGMRAGSKHESAQAIKALIDAHREAV